MHEITISPVTRANSVGGVTVIVEDGKVVKARNEGTIFRGFEMILVGRDPWDAPYLTQRICGICSSAHGLAACLALETAAGAQPPRNAVLTRNLILGLDFLQNHIRQFYVLLLWDWAAPPPMHPFQGGYSRDFRLSDRSTQQLQKHYWQGVNHARLAHEALTLLGGKTPHNHGLVPGGVTLVPERETAGDLRKQIRRLAAFIESIYLPDALLLEEAYPDYRHIGTGRPSYLSFGLFPEPGGGQHYPAGVMLEGNMHPLTLSEITECKAYAYYRGRLKHPHGDKTVPAPAKAQAYSWVKAPRYRGSACQGGPLARSIIRNRQYSKVSSVMERIVARAREAHETSQLMEGWLDEIRPSEPGLVSFKLPPEGSGVGAMEAMRGPLAHWVTLKNGRIATYQIITPSAWNFSPRDHKEVLGPAEEALMDTPVDDPAEPVEIGRVIRSFDPCYACTAHVLDRARGSRKTVQLL